MISNKITDSASKVTEVESKEIVKHTSKMKSKETTLPTENTQNYSKVAAVKSKETTDPCDNDPGKIVGVESKEITVKYNSKVAALKSRESTDLGESAAEYARKVEDTKYV